jgi:pyrroline-5-carboxylate reductase
MTTAIIGAGVMGETLLSGLLRAGVPKSELLIADRRIERSAEVTEKHGVANGTNQEVSAKADTVVLVVKPQDMAIVLGEIKDSLKSSTLVVSLAAGITTMLNPRIRTWRMHDAVFLIVKKHSSAARAPGPPAK